VPVHRRFAQVDVFTATPFRGNPLAVVLDADGLSDDEMQRIARWMNLSETAFVLPPTVDGADYRVRIFGVREEFPFAGHPTLGTARAVLAADMATPRDGALVMQCAAGLVALSVTDDLITFRLPRSTVLPIVDAQRAAASLGGASIIGAVELIDTGPRWLVARVSDVDGIRPDTDVLRAFIAPNAASGITVYAASSTDTISVRTFFFGDSLVEDPICGSGNAAVAVHRRRAGAVGDGATYTARQGRHVGRDGSVYIRLAGDDVFVGGQCVLCVRGEITA
jgi:PhzF family phenazine biosynthesis protein